MSPLSLLPLLLAIIAPSAIATDMRGSATITPHDYPDMGASLVSSFPACGMAYSTLDINRITAVQGMVKADDCGTCLLVSSTVDPTKTAYVLAVDLGGIGLDVSSMTFELLFGTRTDPSPASWAPADAIHCLDIIKAPFETKYPRLASIQAQIDALQNGTTTVSATATEAASALTSALPSANATAINLAAAGLGKMVSGQLNATGSATPSGTPSPNSRAAMAASPAAQVVPGSLLLIATLPLLLVL